jgi:hypothetical protein
MKVLCILMIFKCVLCVCICVLCVCICAVVARTTCAFLSWHECVCMLMEGKQARRASKTPSPKLHQLPASPPSYLPTAASLLLHVFGAGSQPLPTFRSPSNVELTCRYLFAL